MVKFDLHKILRSAIGAVMLGSSGFASASPLLIIDDFKSEWQVLTSSAGVNLTSTGQEAGATIIGGERDVVFTYHGTNAQASGFSLAGLEFSRASNPDGILTYMNGPGVISSARLQYDGSTDSALDDINSSGPGFNGADLIDFTGLGGVDLTVGGSLNAMLVDVFSVDVDSVIAFNVWSDDNNVSHGVVYLSQGTNQEFYLEYTDFEQGRYDFTYNSTDFMLEEWVDLTGVTGGADFANVGAIEMIIFGDAAFDMQLDLIGASSTIVPAPGALVLLGGGLLGVGLLRRRQAA